MIFKQRRRRTQFTFAGVAAPALPFVLLPVVLVLTATIANVVLPASAVSESVFDSYEFTASEEEMFDFQSLIDLQIVEGDAFSSRGENDFRDDEDEDDDEDDDYDEMPFPSRGGDTKRCKTISTY